MATLHADTKLQPRPLALTALFGAGVLASAVLGGVTNAVNGWASPTYFVNIMRWRDVEDVWRASVAQGIFEGLLFGVLFALIFVTGAGLITRASCTFGFGFKHLLGIVSAALVCWVLGGLLAMGLATLSPEFYRRAFHAVPQEFGPMLAYAWVGGSIWGAQLGGLVSIIVGLVLLRGNWLRHLQRQQLA
jgi:hypothetical protein